MRALREFIHEETLLLFVPLSRELGQAPMPHGLGPTSAEAKRNYFVGLTGGDLRAT